MTQNDPSAPEPTLPPTIIACSVIGAVVLISTSLDASKSLGIWLRDYQTLLTGVLALVAAIATIWQMRASDALQERRHLQLRYDAIKDRMLAVGNLLDFFPNAIRSETFTLRAYGNAGNQFSSVLEWHNAILAVERLDEVFNDVRVVACHDFFPNAILEILDACRRKTKQILDQERARKRLDRHDVSLGEASHLLESIIVSGMENLQAEGERLAGKAGEWAIASLMEPVTWQQSAPREGTASRAGAPN